MRPDDCKYLPSHEWCRVVDGVAAIGVTDLGAAMMSSPVFLDLPAVGARVEAGRPFGECETPNGMFDLLSPVAGEVVEVHHELVEHLDQLGSDPFGEGWMIKVRVASEAPGVTDAAGYDRACRGEG
jgi:glycine cleavage system H protein